MFARTILVGLTLSLTSGGLGYAQVTSYCSIVDNGTRWKISATNTKTYDQTCNFTCDLRRFDGTKFTANCRIAVRGRSTRVEVCSNIADRRLRGVIRVDDNCD